MRIISLFSGAGGFDLGLVWAGHKIVWANDNDSDACKTYRKNLGNICEADIATVTMKEIPEGEVVVGGFPCQGFSHANMLRSVDDERNKLYRQFLRVVKGKNPLYFLAENVRGILSLEQGKVIRKIASDFAQLGYKVETRLFNLADYGVPQKRMRVIIAGTRDDLAQGMAFQFPLPTHSGKRLPENENLLPWVSISEALADIPEPGDEVSLPNHIYSKYKVTDRSFTGHRRTDPSKPSPTILARGNGKGGVCAIHHPLNHRRMSIRESATVQTFPLEFEFIGAMNSCYRQVGNALPPKFSERLGQQLAHLERRLKRRGTLG